MKRLCSFSVFPLLHLRQLCANATGRERACRGARRIPSGAERSSRPAIRFGATRAGGAGLEQRRAARAGNPELNQRLSEQRASSVKNALVQYGVPPERIVTRGMGEAFPVASTAHAKRAPAQPADGDHRTRRGAHRGRPVGCAGSHRSHRRRSRSGSSAASPDTHTSSSASTSGGKPASFRSGTRAPGGRPHLFFRAGSLE